MNNSINTELLRAFLQPIIYEIIDERLEFLLSRKLKEINIFGEKEKPLKVKELSEILGFSKSHIYTLCKSDGMPHIKKGGRYFFYLSTINSWLRKN